MDKIVGVVSKAPQTRSQNDDDFADRLSSRYTVVLLVVFAVLVSMNQVSTHHSTITQQPDIFTPS